jgi:hypothetical protein
MAVCAVVCDCAAVWQFATLCSARAWQCVSVCVAVYGTSHGSVREVYAVCAVVLAVVCLVVYDSAAVRVQKYGSVRQCVAVPTGVCGSVWQCAAVCGSVRQCVAVCGSVWQSVAVRTVVCMQCVQCSRQCVTVLLVVHGSVRGSVRPCSSAAVCDIMQCACTAVCVSVCGSVWHSAR